MSISLEKVMGASLLHRKSTNSKRAPRRLILHHCDAKSLLALRLVSKDFKRWVKTEECRYFRDIRITLSLTDDCHLTPADFEALKLPGSIAERVIFTLVVNNGRGKIDFKQRHSNEEGKVTRSSTLNPLPQEGHFDTNGQFSLMEPSIPILGGVFKEFENSLFKRILDMMPRVHSLCIRDKVVWGSHRDKVGEDWGRTLVDEALVYLRCQLEESLLNRLEEFAQVKELTRCAEVAWLKVVTQIVRSPIGHLEEMIRLARILRLDELVRLRGERRPTELPNPHNSRPKKLLARPRFLAWLKELALITESPPARFKELSRLVELPPAQLEEALTVTETLRLDELSRTEEMAQTAESPTARHKLMTRLEKLGRVEESLPARLESLARLEELATLAEIPQARLKLLEGPSQPELQPIPYEELAISADSLAAARLNLRARLNELAQPPKLKLLEMQVGSPLALWHFRTFPGYGDSGNPLQEAGIWATIKTLNITLPSKTPGGTCGRRGTVKKGFHDFLAAFSGQVETLGIGFGPTLEGELPSSINPLSCDMDLEFGGGGEKIIFPALKSLGLKNMQLTWEGVDGLKNFFTEKAPKCINVELSGIHFKHRDSWNQLYKMFTIESPEKKRDFKRNPLVLVRKLELPGPCDLELNFRSDHCS